jgi:uncharacterized protein YjbJ (UPF0337 family)
MSDRGSARDRAEGAIDQAKGKAKQAWGDATGDEQMQGEGMVDEAKGQAKQTWGDIKDAAGDLKDDAERATR